jgi:acyl-CoA synthetase (AMP-forming)/AMP-acid ligase II
MVRNQFNVLNIQNFSYFIFNFVVKLLSRAQRVAYYLLNKTGSKNEPCLKIGDRIALVFPNNDPIGFTIAYCGCIMAGLVALSVDLPITKRDAGCHNLGFIIGQVGASVALTSELCYKNLPKNPTNENVEFKSIFLAFLVVKHTNCQKNFQQIGLISTG